MRTLMSTTIAYVGLCLLTSFGCDNAPSSMTSSKRIEILSEDETDVQFAHATQFDRFEFRSVELDSSDFRFVPIRPERASDLFKELTVGIPCEILGSLEEMARIDCYQGDSFAGSLNVYYLDRDQIIIEFQQSSFLIKRGVSKIREVIEAIRRDDAARAPTPELTPELSPELSPDAAGSIHRNPGVIWAAWLENP